MALGMFHKKCGVRTARTLEKGWFSDWSISPNYTNVRGEAALISQTKHVECSRIR